MPPRGRGANRAGRSGPTTAPGPRVSLAALQARLTGVIEPVARRAGFDLERVRVSRAGRRFSVQVVVDRDGGVGLDAIAEVSRAISPALDAADEAGVAVVPGEYVLEVTSPGVDRPLTEPRHWRRSVGRLVTVAGPGGRRLTGRVVGADDAAVVLEVAGQPRQLRYEQLGPGRVQVELHAAEGPEDTGSAGADLGAPGADETVAGGDGDDDGESESR